MPAPPGPPSGPGPQRLSRIRSALALGLVAALVALAPAAPAAARQPGNAYRQTNLVSDLPGLAQLTDPDLVNPWGLAAGWVADNGTDRATIYPGFVNGSPIQKAGLVVNIPGGAPTGQVFNPTSGFVVHADDASGPARFIFDSEAGLVSGWNPGVPPPPPSTQAQVGASVPDAIYKGLAIATTPAGTFLYAADFHHARIDVFDQGFNRVLLPGSFADPAIPRGFAPFNVQELGGRLYVAYAKQDAAAEDEIAGPSLGFVDVYSTSGQLLRHLIERGQLNAPWGLVLARVRPLQRRPAGRQLRRRPHQRLRPGHWRVSGAAAARGRQPDRDRGAVGAAVWQRRHRQPDHPAVHRRHRG